MGSIIYGSSGLEFAFDDRVLAHLQIVMNAKLRRNECFFFSWFDDPSVGDGRSAAWISPSIPLYFRYSGGRPPQLNREWLEELTISAGSNEGLLLRQELDAAHPVHSTDNSVKRVR